MHGIPHRSCVLRRSCNVEDAHNNLWRQHTNKMVTRVRHEVKNVKEQRGGGKVSWVHRERSYTAAAAGDFGVSRGQPGGVGMVWMGANEPGEGGVDIGGDG